MQLTIESVKPTKSGKSVVVKANGKDYLSKINAGIMAGTVIDAETSDSEYNGKILTWIEKWRPVTSAAPAAAATQPHQTGTNGTAWLPFASNTVAHAINAGLIKEPGQVSAWAKAAKDAFEALA